MNNDQPDNLDSFLNRVADELVHYLAPSITYTGDDDEILDGVKLVFRWIKRVDLSEETGDVIIIQSDLLSIEYLSSLPRNAVLVICQKSGVSYTPEIEDNLIRRFAVTLTDATSDTVIEHINLLLLLRGSFVSDDGDCPIITVGSDYISAMDELSCSMSEFEAIELNVDSLSHGKSILNYLFDNAPEAIKPVTVHPDDPSIRAGQFQPYHVLWEPDSAFLDEVLSKIGSIRRSSEKPPLIVVVTTPLPLRQKTSSIYIPELSQRTSDCYLLACYASIKLSHSNGLGVRYIGETALEEAKKTADDPGSLVEHIGKVVSEQTSDCEDSVLSQLLTTVERVSLRNIIEETENRVFDVMHARLGTIESVAVATGLAAPSIYRKREKHRKNRRNI